MLSKPLQEKNAWFRQDPILEPLHSCQVNVITSNFLNGGLSSSNSLQSWLHCFGTPQVWRASTQKRNSTISQQISHLREFQWTHLIFLISGRRAIHLQSFKQHHLLNEIWFAENFLSWECSLIAANSCAFHWNACTPKFSKTSYHNMCSEDNSMRLQGPAII